MPAVPSRDLSRVAKIALHVDLVSVSCREVSSKRFLELSAIPTVMTWRGSQNVSGHRELDAGQIVVIATFTAQGVEAEKGMEDNDGTGRRVAEIVATLALRYDVGTEILVDFDQSAVQEFAETNGLYNAWPYWREILQTSAARVGLSGVVAPVFRLVGSIAKKDDAEVSK